MSSTPIIFIAAAGLVALFFFGLVTIVTRFYRKVEQGHALIINKLAKDPDITFTGGVVLPIVHKAEVMDISVKTIDIDRRGKDGLICQDNIRADIKVTFFVRVNKTKEDVIKVAQAIGCARASDQGTLENLFSAKFSEALKTVGKKLDFEDLYTKRNEFRDQIIEVIGRDLNGYVLEDAAIDYLEQTPLSSLDEHNILDAQGIRKITELTTLQHIRTNEFENNEMKAIKKQDVERIEAILELERQQADATNKQNREVENVRAREQAEIDKVGAEERLKAELARIKSDEEIGINEENKQRQIGVAEKNRERVLLVEAERVEKDRALEAISREREVELQRIDKEKALEVERKEIQDIIRERVAVERTVAEEEERIKEVRVVEEANRNKKAVIITAEAEAEEALVKDIKAAEAAETASKHKAREILTLADADLDAAEREAKAKIRLAEGIMAESAALGLAEAKVKEADAIATEKHGLAEARIREADAGATERVGAAEASALRDRGTATAEAIEAKMAAEATGIAAKAESMKILDEEGRGHEEYRIRLDNQKVLGLEDINARKEVAEAKARILAKALETADIDIVGGDVAFLDRIVNSISMGKSVDAFIENSNTVDATMKDYISGEKNLIDELKAAVASSSSEGIKNMSLSAVLLQMIASSKGGPKEKLEKLLGEAKSLGLDDRSLG